MLARILMMWLGLFLVVAGCSSTRTDQRPIPGEPAATINRAPQTTGPTTAPTLPPAAIRQRPTLDQEPQIGVLLSQGPSVTLTLEQPAVLTVDGRSQTLPAGTITAVATSTGLRLDPAGLMLGEHTQLRPVGGGVTFRTTAIAPNGHTAALTLSGMPELHLDSASRKAQLVERIGMDTYLVGVLAKEMSNTWPMEALKAQAVVARSYAADRFLQNWERSWQLHWHYTVDMAYPGWSPDAGRARDAIQATHGELLMYAGQPLPALFHASSGGRTASIEEIKPGLTLADGRTDPAPALAPVDDPAAKDGAKALNLSRSHWQWSASFTLDHVESELKAWLSTHPNRGEIGDVKSVKIIDRHEDSGRVATVAVVSRLHGKDETLRMPANDFRMAIGPVDLKSTLWTRCEVRKKRLVIEGRGFGHGVGLSQISAWWLAKSGVNAEEILKRFYPKADIRRSW